MFSWGCLGAGGESPWPWSGQGSEVVPRPGAGRWQWQRGGLHARSQETTRLHRMDGGLFSRAHTGMDGDMFRSAHMRMAAQGLLLLLLSGDVETNPGPPKSPQKRVKPPTEKEIMEGRVTNHDERLAALEKLVKEQKVVIDGMAKTQVELTTALADSKVEFEQSVAENKVLSTTIHNELKVNIETKMTKQKVGTDTLPTTKHTSTPL